METDEEVNKIKNQILAISAKKSFKPFTSTFFSDTDLRLDVIAKKIVNHEEPPIVLWNVQPWNNFNILHAIYCQKLKEYEEIGFNCVVILYDKMIEKKIGRKDQEKIHIQQAVRNCIKWFKKAGLKDEKTEFLTESDLLSFIKSYDFADTLTSLAHVCNFNKNWVKKEGVVSFIMDNLCEIYYESVINCDILLTSDEDIQKIWGMLRTKILDRNLLPNYTPPLILYYPTLTGTDNQSLSTSNNNNSLSITHTTQELKQRIETCSEHFLETIVDFLIIPNRKKIEAQGKMYYSFEDLKEKIPIEQIRELIFEFLKGYLFLIRGIDYEL